MPILRKYKIMQVNKRMLQSQQAAKCRKADTESALNNE